jgi:predicted RNA-binding Zn ribbon-like protein
MSYAERGGGLELSGNLALDLVNTIVPGRDGPVDLLGTPMDLATWFEAAGVSGGALGPILPDSPPLLRLLLAEAIRLRAAIVRLLEAASARKPVAEDVRFAIDRVMAEGHRSTRMAGESGTLIEIREARTPLGLLAPVAVAAARLAVEADAARLRPCAARDCTRWFLDTSKGGRRRWCSMTTCGNRAKAARFRRRHGGG